LFSGRELGGEMLRKQSRLRKTKRTLRRKPFEITVFFQLPSTVICLFPPFAFKRLTLLQLPSTIKRFRLLFLAVICLEQSKPSIFITANVRYFYLHNENRIHKNHITIVQHKFHQLKDDSKRKRSSRIKILKL
jgi:hypothetical protein